MQLFSSITSEQNHSALQGANAVNSAHALFSSDTKTTCQLSFQEASRKYWTSKSSLRLKSLKSDSLNQTVDSTTSRSERWKSSLSICH